MLLGAHFSSAKGLDKALYEAQRYGCSTLQLFTKNAQTWRERSVSDEDIRLFAAAKQKTGITRIVSHTSYLINMAAPDAKKNKLSRMALKNELARSSLLKIPYVVLHPGSHMKKGEDYGIKTISAGIKSILEKSDAAFSTRLLLETTAGQGTGLGHTFEQLANMLELIGMPEKIGICLDTCHIFAAGYDIRTEKAYLETLEQFERIIGLNALYVIHLNDSKKKLGSRVDRHAHIGHGFIGIDAFKYIMNDPRLKKIPKILETQKSNDSGHDMDKKNLEILRGLYQQ